MFLSTHTCTKAVQLHRKRQKSTDLEKLLFLIRTFHLFVSYDTSVYFLLSDSFRMCKVRLNKLGIIIENEINLASSLFSRSLTSKSSGYYL